MVRIWIGARCYGVRGVYFRDGMAQGLTAGIGDWVYWCYGQDSVEGFDCTV